MAIQSQFVDGSPGSANITESLAHAAKGCCEIDVATAFLTSAGAEKLLELVDSMKGPKAQRSVRVLVGLWQGVTEPKALWSLFKRKDVALKLASVHGFHAKHYIFRTKKETTCFIGSANLTAKGLAGEGEVLVRLTDTRASNFGRQEADLFRRLWKGGVDATDAILRKYEAGWTDRRGEIASGAKADRLLQKPENKGAKREAPTVWLAAYGQMSKATLREVERSSKWQGKEPDEDDDLVGSHYSGVYPSVEEGVSRAWVGTLFGREKYIQRCTVIGKALHPVKGEGKYWFSLRADGPKITIDDALADRLKELGLVKKWRSLDSPNRVLSTKVIAALEALPTKAKRGNRSKAK